MRRIGAITLFMLLVFAGFFFTPIISIISNVSRGLLGLLSAINKTTTITNTSINTTGEQQYRRGASLVESLIVFIASMLGNPYVLAGLIAAGIIYSVIELWIRV